MLPRKNRPENYARMSEFLFRAKRFNESENILKQAIKEYPDSEPLKRTLIGVIESQNDQPRAEKQILSFIDDAEEPEVTQVYLAEKLFSWKRETEAVDLLKTISEQKKSEKAALSAMNLLALYQQSKGNLDEAMKLVNQVIERNPADAQALNFRARVALEKGDYDSAVTDLRAALNQDKQNPQVMKPLVVAYLKKGDTDLALDQVKTLLNVDPMGIESRTLAAQVFEQKKDFAAVDEQLNAAIRLQPNNESVLQALVGNAVQLKAWDKVRNYTSLWSKLNPDNPKAYYLHGLADEALDQPEQALENFNRSLTLAPGSVEPATAIVRLYLARNRNSEAKVWLDAALQKGESAHLLNLKGEVLLADKDFQGARKSFEAAIAKQPDWWVPYRTLAMLSADQKDSAAAESWFLKGIENVRNSSLLRAEYAALLERNGNTDAAIDQYREIVKSDKGVPEAAINNLAMLLVTYNATPQKIDEALALVARLESTQNPWYLDTVGWVNLKAGKLDKAVQFIQRAADMVADQPVIQYHLGVAFFAQKDAVKAVSALQASLSSGKKFPGIKDAESLLKKIQSESQQG
jgi:tetratricopeptide (TPR) repeat protein